ncbi:MAG: 30S ribosomal protein S14 [Cyanobacteria bacterium M5B4]|nr:MAG: 30S ribosomal protein S14 [Cyanobacteria bacterium M5B4]
MAKKSMVEREKKRLRLVEKYAAKRELLKERMMTEELTQSELLDLHRQLQRLPRNSSPNRLRNRCRLTGRPRAYYRDFGLCRNMLREMAHQGLLPGLVKSSW